MDVNEAQEREVGSVSYSPYYLDADDDLSSVHRHSCRR